MGGLDDLGAGKRGDRASDARHTSATSTRERQPVDRVRQELGGRLGSPRSRRPQALACRDDPRPRTAVDGSAGGAASSAARGRGIATARSKRSSERPRQLLPVRREPLRRAGALDGGIAARAARAHVHRPDELEASREERVPADARDRDHAVLERLPQRLENGARELGQLVEEQHAVMGERHLARSRARSRRRRSPAQTRRGAAPETARLDTSARPGGSRPATEWMRVTSSASARVSGGRIPGRRRASIVLPVPGGPIEQARCASRRRRSRAHGGRAPARARPRDRAQAGSSASSGSGSYDGASISPRKYATTSPRWRTGTGSMPASAASGADSAAQTTRLETGAARPFGDGERPRHRPDAPVERRARRPRRARRAAREGAACVAPRTASEIGRSKPEPSLRSAAGARLTVIRRLTGHSSAAETTPLRTRCFASWQARSARPTIAKPGMPGCRCASTSTFRGSRPTSAWVTARASTHATVGTRGADRAVNAARVPSSLTRAATS